jgi:predicted nucleic acid-binding Zn ribbon protein
VADTSLPRSQLEESISADPDGDRLSKVDPVTMRETCVTPSSTMDGGKPALSVDNHPQPIPTVNSGLQDGEATDLVSAALIDAQQLARRRSGGFDAAGSRSQPRRRSGFRSRRSRRGGYSAAGPDPLDPAAAKNVLAGLFAERGWDHTVAQARVFADWPSLVGAEIATRCHPVSLTDGQLRIAAESTAWATQLRLLSGTLLARLAAQLGPQVVTRVEVSGPVAPSWRHGAWSVRGARGPRDTYG